MRHTKIFRNSALSLLLTTMIIALVPLGAVAQNEHVGLGGPYVDEIVWEIFGSDEAALMAFLRGDIEMPAGFNDIDKQVMDADPNIEVVKPFGGLSFTFLIMNVWPNAKPENYSSPGVAEALNDVQFRKALAHMVDRQFLKDHVWGDRLEIYDSVVPIVYGDWVSPDVIRYEHSFARANEILDEAGYLDVNDDGFRETPTNQTLTIELAAIVTLSDVVQAARYIEVWAENEVGLDIEVVTPDRTFVNNVFAHKFDMWLSTQATRSTQSGPESVLMSSFYSSTVDYMDFSGWENATFQEAVDNMTSTLDESLAKEYCWKAQELESDAVPVVNLGQYISVDAYRTDEFVGWVSEPGKGVNPSYWNWLNVRSKTRMGGSVHIPLTSEPGKTNFVYYRTCGQAFPYLINEPLFLPSGPLAYEPTPRLAKSWSYEEATVANTSGMIITFNLVDNATWHDGEPFTSEDVKYTLDYLNDNNPVVMFGFYANKGWIDHVETPDNYTVKVYINRQSLFAVPGIGLCPILPEHVWGNKSWSEWDPIDGPHVGTGPWKFKDRVIGEYIIYERNLNYYYPPLGWPTPVASFTFTPTEPRVNETVTFDASTSYHPNGTIETYMWIFGDGHLGTGVTTTHAYSTRGTYTAALTVVDTEGRGDVMFKTVTVGGPVASFSYTPAEPTVEDTVTFDASTSHHPDGTIATYAWSFGDENIGTGVTATHKYSTAGTYTVVLNVTDTEGLWDTESKTVTVEAVPVELPWLWIGVGVGVVVVVIAAAAFLLTRKGKTG